MVADTHSRPHPRALEWVARERPDHILHAGDIGDLAVLDALSRIAPVAAVKGNIDAGDLPDARTLTLTGDDGEARLAILLLHIGVNGPRLRADAARLARAEGAGLVVCGHSHVPFVGRDRGLAIFNPGSIGPRRFALPIVFGMLEVAAGSLAMHHIDGESGDRWRP